MALPAGRQSWTNNGSYGSFVKSVMHHKDDEWDSNGPNLWYQSENGAYGSFQGAPASFKDISSYRHNMKKNWEFKVSPTTYDELGAFYYGKQPPEFKQQQIKPGKSMPHLNFAAGGYLPDHADAAVQSSSADIHFLQEGKVSRSAQINEEELLVNARQVKFATPEKLPPLKQGADHRMVNTSPLPDISKQKPTDEKRPSTPLDGILQQLDQRERGETAWHRYMDEKSRFLEDLRKKTVQDARSHSPEKPFVPAVHVPDEYELNHPKSPIFKAKRPQVPQNSSDEDLKRSHFYTSRVAPQPAQERVFVPNDYGGDSRWSNQQEYGSGKAFSKRNLPPSYRTPVYIETPWPMNMTAPIQAHSHDGPAVGILPNGDSRDELAKRTSFGRGGGKYGIKALYDYTGTRSLYVA